MIYVVVGIIYHKIKKGTAHRSNNKQITEIKMKKKTIYVIIMIMEQKTFGFVS